MTAYRDTFPACPRCKGDLLESGSYRACKECGGQWVPGPVLQEMANNMQSAPVFAHLQFVSDPHEVLACPECGDGMQTWRLHNVPIDRCAKWHGIWFDRDELQAVLLGSVRFTT